VGPLAIAERAFGVDQPLTNQVFLLPMGVAAGFGVFRGIRPLLTGPVVLLRIAAECLEFEGPGRSVARVDRSGVGAVIVDADPLGTFTFVVHDDKSRVVYRGSARWPGRRPASVVRKLSQAGWPSAVGAELYDGRFRGQMPGQPPVIRRPKGGGR
jgi:hypothetical protein